MVVCWPPCSTRSWPWAPSSYRLVGRHRPRCTSAIARRANPGETLAARAWGRPSGDGASMHVRGEVIAGADGAPGRGRGRRPLPGRPRAGAKASLKRHRYASAGGQRDTNDGRSRSRATVNGRRHDRPDRRRIRPVPSRTSCARAYLDYAMSVIVARALPDVRDGLKPVHRRILYTMHEMGLRSTCAYRKCAAIVGEVHGQVPPARRPGAVRRAGPPGPGLLAALPAGRRAGQLRLGRRRPAGRHALHRGAHDGDRRRDAGRHRQGHRRLRRELRRHPRCSRSVLPARLPNLLVNGSAGIAVGMATNIPPHNLGEIADATIALIDNPELTVDELCEIVTGPRLPHRRHDLPLRGPAQRRSPARGSGSTPSATCTPHGRGRVVMRGQVAFEETRQGRTAIVVTELPYQVNKATLVEKIAELVSAEQDRRHRATARRSRPRRHAHGHRVQARRPRRTRCCNNLFKHTRAAARLQREHAGAGRRPAADAAASSGSCEHHIDWRREVIRRRTEFDLQQGARPGAHPRRPEDRPRQPGRGDQAPSARRPTSTTARAQPDGALQADRGPGQRDPGDAAPPAGRARAQEDRGRVRGRSSSSSPSWRTCSPTRARSCSIIKRRARPSCKRKYGDPRRTRDRVRRRPRDDRRGPGRRRGRRRHPHAARLHQAPADRHLPPPGRGGKGIIGHDTREEDAVAHLLVANTHDCSCSSPTAGASSSPRSHAARGQPPGEGPADHQPARGAGRPGRAGQRDHHPARTSRRTTTWSWRRRRA